MINLIQSYDTAPSIVSWFSATPECRALRNIVTIRETRAATGDQELYTDPPFRGLIDTIRMDTSGFRRRVLLRIELRQLPLELQQGPIFSRQAVGVSTGYLADPVISHEVEQMVYAVPQSCYTLRTSGYPSPRKGVEATEILWATGLLINDQIQIDLTVRKG